MDVSDYKQNSPEFILEEYFNGKTVAYGVFENRSGEVVNQFKVDITGSVEGDVLTLDEDFIYKNGKIDKRLWKINILPNGEYEGTTNGVIGTARGKRSGNAFNWIYVFDLPVGETSYKLKFNDWMFLQEDGVIGMGRDKDVVELLTVATSSSHQNTIRRTSNTLYRCV